MNILGISAYYHDSAACLVRDGTIIAAAQEERFTRKKFDERFPAQAIAYCLKEGGITAADLDIAAFYEKPILKFDRIIESHVAFAPFGWSQFSQALGVWLRKKLWMSEEIKRSLAGFKGTLLFPRHHESHAASAFFPSPFPEAIILVLDAVGEWHTSTIGVGEGNRITLKEELNFPHSLGMLYSAFTYYCGFRVNSGEYKLMGLAPYGEPKYEQRIREYLLDLKDDGSFRLDMTYFNYGTGLTMTTKKFHDLFGRPPRNPAEPLTQLDMDIAASIQAVTNDIMLRIARHARERYGKKYLVMAGGVALNCVANGELTRSGLFEDIWIQPAAGDAGGALGAALMAWYQHLGNPRTVAGNGRDAMQGSFLGPSYGRAEIKAALDGMHAVYQERTEDVLLNEVAGIIAQGHVVGWFDGRMEFGPRALGARSIIGDPRNRTMQSVMNLKIKFRESFRPFAPAVLAERANEYFVTKRQSPYMLFTHAVVPQKRVSTDDQGLAGLDKLKMVRSEIPAVTHVDYSARIQTVTPEVNGRFYRLVRRFAEKTGCPVLINTSFNVRGEPIVCTPEDAYRCFMRTGIDYLVVGDFLLTKNVQPPFIDDKIGVPLDDD